MKTRRLIPHFLQLKKRMEEQHSCEDPVCWECGKCSEYCVSVSCVECGKCQECNPNPCPTCGRCIDCESRKCPECGECCQKQFCPLCFSCITCHWKNCMLCILVRELHFSLDVALCIILLEKLGDNTHQHGTSRPSQ